LSQASLPLVGILASHPYIFTGLSVIIQPIKPNSYRPIVTAEQKQHIVPPLLHLIVTDLKL